MLNLNHWLVLLGISGLAAACGTAAARGADPAATSTPWRNDVANLEITTKLNQAYARLPFSVEYEGVLDERPLEIQWGVGPNLPVAWKGGVAGVIGEDIVLAGGLWMPGYKHLAYRYSPRTQAYHEIPPPSVNPQYTQGACDGRALFVVGGRSAGRSVFRLAKDEADQWKWTELARLPEGEGGGRWLAAVGLVPGKWLFLVGGHPSGGPSEAQQARMRDLRLRLDQPGAQWEPMAPYPPGKRNLISAAVVKGKLYAFGGSETDPAMRAIHQELSGKYHICAPYNGVPNYRDAFCYDADQNQWRRLRSLPCPMAGGGAVAYANRYVLLLGSADVRATRVGRTEGRKDAFCLYYGDMVYCYDVEKDNYARVGVMPYGVATSPWVLCDHQVFSFGGEPAHGYLNNTENVLQIGTIQQGQRR